MTVTAPRMERLFSDKAGQLIGFNFLILKSEKTFLKKSFEKCEKFFSDTVN
jgi:hypothetical protein